MLVNKTRGIIGTTAAGAICAAAMVGTAPAAKADGQRLAVSVLASPVWSAYDRMPLHVVVANPDAQLLCDTVTVKVSWRTETGRTLHVSAAGRPDAGVWAGTMMLPGQAMWAGTRNFVVRAHETCGIILTTVAYRGRASWSTTVAP